MARYPLGAPVRVPTTVRQLNTDGTTTLVNATTLTLLVKIRNADGTSSTTGTYAAPSNDGTGLYHQDIPAADLTILGHYQYTWTATGTGAGVSFGDFDVFDPFEPALLPLADGKDELNIPQSVTAYDTEVAAYIATIETSMEAMTGGPLLNTTVTERAEFSPGMLTLQVRQRPLVSVTSVTSVPNGAAVDLSAGLDLDSATGEIRTKGGWPFSAFSPLATVIYVAGWGTVTPAAFNLAARIILGFLWENQHGPSARPSMGGGADELAMVPGFPYAIPWGAVELLRGGMNGLPFVCEVFA